MQVQVMHVDIPAGSTIGYAFGFGPDGQVVHFVGDHRPMVDLWHAVRGALLEASALDADPHYPTAEVPEFAIQRIEEEVPA
jgi:hypothetical protein